MVEKSKKEEKARAWPSADNKLSKDLVGLVSQAANYKQV